MAPYWLPHVRLAFGGTLGTQGFETWSNTLRFMEGDGLEPTRDSLVTTAAALQTPLSTWIGAAGSLIGSSAKMTWIKLNFIKSDGKQRDVDTVLHQWAGMNGGVASSGAPWYQTYALTHRTPAQRGRAHAGRIFPPVVSAYVTPGEPYVSTTIANGMATSWATCINSVRGVLNSNLGGAVTKMWFPVVMSPGDTDKPGAAATCVYQPITGVVADRVPDVQHRRTKQVPRAEGAVQAVAQG